MNKIYPRKTLFDTQDRTIFSTHTDRDYHLSVWLPPSYGTSNLVYPVVYLLDGDINFGMATGLTALSHWMQGIAELIVVGINYDMESYDQFIAQRERDFKIPEIEGAPADSYANLFLKTLTQEIIPLIEANYRTVPSERCLYGYSSSGFFVLYTLLNEPDAFKYFLSGSGELEKAYLYLLNHDQKLLARDPNNPIRLYISMGELEDDQQLHFHNIISFLEDRKYPGLRLTTEIYQGERHGAEGVVLTYLHGIRIMYPAPLAQE